MISKRAANVSINLFPLVFLVSDLNQKENIFQELRRVQRETILRKMKKVQKILKRAQKLRQGLVKINYHHDTLQ